MLLMMTVDRAMMMILPLVLYLLYSRGQVIVIHQSKIYLPTYNIIMSSMPQYTPTHVYIHHTTTYIRTYVTTARPDDVIITKPNDDGGYRRGGDQRRGEGGLNTHNPTACLHTKLSQPMSSINSSQPIG